MPCGTRRIRHVVAETSEAVIVPDLFLQEKAHERHSEEDAHIAIITNVIS